VFDLAVYLPKTSSESDNNEKISRNYLDDIALERMNNAKIR